MKNNPFYFEIQNLVTQFCSAFDSIIINRYDGADVDKSIRVRYIYAPKQRALHSMVNKAEHITVPAVAVFPTNISRDKERVFSKNTGFYKNNRTNTDHILAPVPINIGINMTIIARYMSDMDQILSNFIPYNNPYIIISWKLPEEFSHLGSEIRSEVLWNETVSINAPTEMNEGDKYRVTADTSFTIKGWMFKKHEDTLPNIFTIDSNFYTAGGIDFTENIHYVNTVTVSATP